MSKKKTKTTGTSTQTATTTPNVPDWILQPYQTAATRVGGLQSRNPMDFAPDSTPALDQVWSDAGNLRGADLSGAEGLLGGVNYDLGGVSAKDLMGGYRDLFSADVIDPVMADFDENAGQVRAAQAASGARNGAFRGARFGLREGQTEGELARGRAATKGGLLRDAANFALAGATGDAGRIQSGREGDRAARFQGSGLLASMAGQRSADERAALDMRGRFASQGADLANARRRAPLDYEKQMQGLLAGLNPGLFTGQTVAGSGTTTGTTTQSGGFLGDFLLALAGGAGSRASSVAAGGA